MKASPNTILRAENDQGTINRFGAVGEPDNPGAKMLTLKSVASRLMRWSGKAEPDHRSDYVDACSAFAQKVNAVLEAPGDDEGAQLLAATEAFEAATKGLQGIQVPSQAIDSAKAAVARVPGTLPAEDRAAFAEAVSQMGIEPEPSEKTVSTEKKNLAEVLGALSDEDRAVIENALSADKKEDDKKAEDEEKMPPEDEKAADESEKAKPEVEEALKGENESLKSQLQAVQKQMDEMKAKQEHDALVTKAKSLNVGAETELVVKALKGDGASAEQVLKSLSAQLNKNNVLLKNLGRPDVPEDSLMGQLQAEKARIAKEKGITTQQAQAELAKTAEGRKLINEAYAEKAE